MKSFFERYKNQTSTKSVHKSYMNETWRKSVYTKVTWMKSVTWEIYEWNIDKVSLGEIYEWDINEICDIIMKWEM